MVGTPDSPAPDPSSDATRVAWRDATRERLARERRAIAADALARAGRRVADALEPLLGALFAPDAAARPSGAAPGTASPRPPVVAGYAAVRGELPVDAALARARDLGAITALPVTSGASMRFVAFDETTPTRAGRFGIVVPDAGPDARTFAPDALDLVLVPLLGFDARLDRLGMGGGFYDRAFAHRARGAPGPAAPLLVGVAHAFQRVDDVRAMAWDVPLDAVATELGLVRAADAPPR